MHKIPAGIPYPSGEIRVLSLNLQDISGGMQWNMQQADSIQFLAVTSRVDYTALYRWILSNLAWLSQYDTDYVFVDNRELASQNHPDYALFCSLGKEQV